MELYLSPTALGEENSSYEYLTWSFMHF